MPWTRSSFAKHWKAGSPAQLTHAASLANKLLAAGKDEGSAISIAISQAKKAGSKAGGSKARGKKEVK